MEPTSFGLEIYLHSGVAYAYHLLHLREPLHHNFPCLLILPLCNAKYSTELKGSVFLFKKHNLKHSFTI